MNKYVYLLLFCIFLPLTFIFGTETVAFPAFNGPDSSWQTDDTTASNGVLEGLASSDGHFSLSYSPDFSIGKFAFQLNIKIKGSYETDPFDLALDFSDWELPERVENETNSAYLMSLAKQYSTLFRSIQYGERYEPIYIRYGKLLGITLGDGALINGFLDKGVAVRSTRPGLDVMLDGQLLGIENAGFEFITNDIFSPTLTAWRIFARPLTDYENEPQLSNMQVGLSFARSPQREEDSEHSALGRQLIALDFSFPVYEDSSLSLDLFTDFLLQLPDTTTSQPAFALRYGLWGHSKSILVFNTSITAPTFGVYYADYFSSNFESRTQEELLKLIVKPGTLRLDGMFGLNFASQGLYMRTKLVSNYTQGDYHDHHFLANVRIDKRFFNIVSLDLTYEKLYPTSSNEGFFEGLKTLRNVVLTTSAVVKVKPYAFDIALNVIYDDEQEMTFTFETAVRISIL